MRFISGEQGNNAIYFREAGEQMSKWREQVNNGYH